MIQQEVQITSDVSMIRKSSNTDAWAQYPFKQKNLLSVADMAQLWKMHVEY